MNSRAKSSQEITRRSKSNLAFALTALSKERKRDMITFYAFCRVIDDIADEPGYTLEGRLSELNAWRDGLENGFTSPDELQEEMSQLPKRYPISVAHLLEIIDGVKSDLTCHRYQTYEQLLSYCYKVASVVGLVSIEIFGYKNPQCREYAVNLGYALQLTNIVRDVGEDARNGRIYLPQEEMQKFGVTEEQIFAGRHSPELVALLAELQQRARNFYKHARHILPREDRRQMLAAEMMGKIYSDVLRKIERSNYQVLDRRIGISKLRKLAILGTYIARGLIRR